MKPAGTLQVLPSQVLRHAHEPLGQLSPGPYQRPWHATAKPAPCWGGQALDTARPLAGPAQYAFGCIRGTNGCVRQIPTGARAKHAGVLARQQPQGWQRQAAQRGAPLQRQSQAPEPACRCPDFRPAIVVQGTRPPSGPLPPLRPPSHRACGHRAPDNGCAPPLPFARLGPHGHSVCM